jgi:Na+/melibiose symporter-like transporter
MIVVGFMLMMVFVVHEIYIAPKPLMTKSIIQNRAFLAALGVDVCTQMASGLRTTYFASYVWIIKDWSQYAWTIFIGSVTLGLCFFGPIAGLIQRKTHRYKSLMVFGAVSKLLANGVLMAGNGGGLDLAGSIAVVVENCERRLGLFFILTVGFPRLTVHLDHLTGGT